MKKEDGGVKAGAVAKGLHKKKQRKQGKIVALPIRNS
jgi:hypothetical protein